MPLIFDTIYGSIDFDKNDLIFLDNRWVKRMKRVKQLGLLEHVFPGGSHNRFEHIIGVYYLADKYIDLLNKNNQCHKFTDKEKRCIKLAGLFHDLGHGPYSHIFDHFLEDYRHSNPYLLYEHEKRSQLIVEEIFKETQPNGFTGYDIDLIKKIIEPPSEMILERNGLLTYNCEKPYLFQIINNKLNGIDIDRFDYLQRDAKHIGLDYAFNPDRIFHKSMINSEKTLIYDISLKNNIFDLFYTRYRFHKDIYNHKTVKMIELMLSDALKEINDCVDCPFEDKFIDICSTDNNKINEEFLYLDDSIYNKLLRNTNKCANREKSKNLIKRIEERNLYKLIYYGPYSDDIVSKYKDSHISKIRFTLSSIENGYLKNIIFSNKFDNTTSIGLSLKDRLVPDKNEEIMAIVYNK